MTESTRGVLETVGKVLLRCWIIGLIIQLITNAAALGNGGLIHFWHVDLFGLTEHESDLILVQYLGFLKLMVTAFFIPWLAIWLVLRKNPETT